MIEKKAPSVETAPTPPKKKIGGFKTNLVALERQIRKAKAQLERLVGLEKHSREKWTKGYESFMKAADDLAKLEVHNTQKEAKLKKTIKAWPREGESARLTAQRDNYRAHIKETEQVLIALGLEQATLVSEQIAATSAEDEIVNQVFKFNEIVVRASNDREVCLNKHVFPRLIKKDGELGSQIGFTGKDGLRRVIAMVNTITVIRKDLAGEAMVEIHNFFARFQEVAMMDENIKPLYELTRHILVEKTDFKVGPTMHRFLSIEFDPELCPELVRAQALLRDSIRFEKTNTYIRLKIRESHEANWVDVPQS